MEPSSASKKCVTFHQQPSYCWSSSAPSSSSSSTDRTPCTVNVVAAVFVGHEHKSVLKPSTSSPFTMPFMLPADLPCLPRTSRILFCSVCGLLVLALAQMYASLSLILNSTSSLSAPALSFVQHRFIAPAGMAGPTVAMAPQSDLRRNAARKSKRLRKNLGASKGLPYHVNFGAKLLPIEQIPIMPFAQEDYDDVHDEVLRKLRLHERKYKKKPYYKFPQEKMGILYNRTNEDIMCYWKQQYQLKWLNSSTPPFDQSPSVAKYFLPGPFIKGSVYNSCVVVSNAGDMLNSSLGKFIDSHELVFRINDAPTEDFDRDVGSTTSVRILNNNIWRDAYNPSKDRDMGFHSSPMYRDVVLTVWEACLNRGPFSSCLKNIGTPFVRKGKNEKDDTLQPYFRRRQEFPEELFYFMNPEMLWDSWDLLQYFSPVPIAPRIPSSGFLAIFVSFWHCRMVDLVGFTPTVRFRRGRGGDHYFDKFATGEWGSFNLFHPKVTEMSLLYRLNTLPDETVFINGVMRMPGFEHFDCYVDRGNSTKMLK